MKTVGFIWKNECQILEIYENHNWKVVVTLTHNLVSCEKTFLGLWVVYLLLYYCSLCHASSNLNVINMLLQAPVFRLVFARIVTTSSSSVKLVQEGQNVQVHSHNIIKISIKVIKPKSKEKRNKQTKTKK